MCARNSTASPRQRLLLCYVTDRHSLSALKGGDPIDLLLEKIEDAITAGVDWVQIREKDLSAKDLAHVVEGALRIAAKHSSGGNMTRILVNDRLDVAVTENAGGLHLGEKSLPVAEAKALLRTMKDLDRKKNFLVGVSCHSKDAAQLAARCGADYIFFGPIFATPSKAAFGAPQGLERLAEVCRTIKIPVVAIGGVTQENAASCIAAGAAGIAAIRLFQDAPDVRTQIASLRAAIAHL